MLACSLEYSAAEQLNSSKTVKGAAAPAGAGGGGGTAKQAAQNGGRLPLLTIISRHRQCRELVARGQEVHNTFLNHWTAQKY
jgi:hypothetical protein